MLKGYRCILLAFVGIALTAAGPPNQAAHTNQIQANHAEAKRPPYKPDPARHAESCYQNPDHEAADLCAQWSAADAARETAGLSYWGNWISLGAAVLSFVSILLVLFALRQGRDANGIAERTAAQELRPYVASKGVQWQILNPESPDGGLLFNLIWENAGSIPAFDLKMVAQSFVQDKATPPLQIDSEFYPTPLGPRSTINCQDLFVSASDIQRGYEQQAFIFLAATVEYTDGFSKKKRVAKCCYQIFTNRDPAKPHNWAATNWVRWLMVGPHNGFEGEERA